MIGKGAVRYALVALASLALVIPPAHADELPFDPKTVGTAQQLIVVTAPTYRSTEGSLQTYEFTDGSWQLVHKTVRAQLGYGGLVPGNKRRQGTGTTPIGLFAVLDAFGRKPDPGARVPYVRVDRNDAWTYNPRVPRTYNVFQTADRSWKSYGNYVEMLWDMGMQYNYVSVLDYNLPGGSIRTKPNGVRVSDAPPNTQRGGGIFLHVDNGRKTAGCIAIEESVMRDVLTWIDPAKDPHILITVT